MKASDSVVTNDTFTQIHIAPSERTVQYVAASAVRTALTRLLEVLATVGGEGREGEKVPLRRNHLPRKSDFPAEAFLLLPLSPHRTHLPIRTHL